MALAYAAKDPEDIDDFTIDWSNVIASGETISTATATVVGGEVTAASPSISGSLTTTRLSGGTAGIIASVRVRIVTSTGRQLDQTMTFQIEQA